MSNWVPLRVKCRCYTVSQNKLKSIKNHETIYDTRVLVSKVPADTISNIVFSIMNNLSQVIWNNLILQYSTNIEKNIPSKNPFIKYHSIKFSAKPRAIHWCIFIASYFAIIGRLNQNKPIEKCRSNRYTTNYINSIISGNKRGAGSRRKCLGCLFCSHI